MEVFLEYKEKDLGVDWGKGLGGLGSMECLDKFRNTPSVYDC